MRFGLFDHSRYIIVTYVDRANRNQTLLSYSVRHIVTNGFNVIEFGLLILLNIKVIVFIQRVRGGEQIFVVILLIFRSSLCLVHVTVGFMRGNIFINYITRA